MALPFRAGIKQINKADEKEKDDRLWEAWLTRYQGMNQGNFMSFEEFKNKAARKKQTDQDMMLMARALNAAFGGTEVMN